MSLEPPVARRGDVVDDLHGHRVADPYRWLEDPDADETRAWIEGQNAATEAWLEDADLRAPFRASLARLWDWPKAGPPVRKGDHWFQLRNPGLDPQSTLWVADASDAVGRPLLDPTTLADGEDGTASLTGLAHTRDGALVAHAISQAGSDWITWRIRDVATGQDLRLPDGTVEAVPWAKFAGAVWLPDASGFLYGGYAPPTSDSDAVNVGSDTGMELRLHVLGTPATDDVVVYSRPDEPLWGFQPHVTHDGRYLLVQVWEGTQPWDRWLVRPLTPPRGADVASGDGPVSDGPAAAAHTVDWTDRDAFRWLFAEPRGERTFAGTIAGELFFRSDVGAPRCRVIGVDLAGVDLTDHHTEPEPFVREVVPEGQDTIERVKVVGGRLLVLTLHHALHRLAVVDPNPVVIAAGTAARWVTLPGIGTVEQVAGGHDDADAHLTFGTFLTPPTVLRFGVADDEPVALPLVTTPDEAAGPRRGLDPTAFTVDQVFVEHRGPGGRQDPVRIPVFLVRRADLAPDGEVPTILWGYGGFNIPITPAVRPGWLAWVSAGGLLAVACLRGGGEYGRAWHDDGRLAHKQHVFDDAIAVSEWLTGTGRATDDGGGPRIVDVDGRDLPWHMPWTRPDRLGVEGRSNGGLLAGALLTQRPDLFGSVVPEVGVLDMLRFHKFTIGWGWVSDYGCADDPEQLEWLLGYSPLHTLRDDVEYPATLVTTGDHDDRVVPGHSFKFAAALQHAKRAGDRPQDVVGDLPALIRIDTSAGHGAGKPTAKLIDERADVLAFHARALDAEHLLDPG